MVKIKFILLLLEVGKHKFRNGYRYTFLSSDVRGQQHKCIGNRLNSGFFVVRIYVLVQA